MTGKRKIEWLGLLLVILLAANWMLGAWSDRKAEKEEEEEEKQKIYLTDQKEITAYSYTNGDTEMSFTKSDGTWQDDQDTEIPLNQDSVQSMADSIRQLEAVRELDSPDAMSDYGLDTPSYTISYTDSSGDTSVISLGNGASEDYYATVGDTGKVYTVSSEFVDSLSFDLSALVQNDIVPSIGSGNLKKVTVTENGTDTVYKDEDAIGELAGGFGTLTLTSPVNYHVTEDQLAGYGLDESSRITVKAKYKDNETKKKKTFTIYVGGTDDSGENRYVMKDGSKLVYQISNSVAQNLMTVEETDGDTGE